MDTEKSRPLAGDCGDGAAKCDIVYRDDLGRCLVASTDIAEGEVIFIDTPLMTGPKLNSGYMCLGCYTNLSQKDLTRCSRCSWPVCGPECETRGYHPLECQVFANSNYKLDLADFGENKPLYEAILPLRCLLLRDKDANKWNQLMDMQSHDDFRRGGDMWQYEQRNVCDFLRDRIGLPFTDDLIHSVTGILDINSHEVRSQNSDDHARGVFPMCAMMAHNCACNTVHCILDDHTMVLIASVSIAKGEQITGTYTHLLSGTTERRKHLRYGKFFDCICKRCADPTELGTFFSALRCKQPNCSGDVLCKDPLRLDNRADYACNKCGHEVSSETVEHISDTIGAVVQEAGETNITLLEDLLQQYSPLLHPSHYHIISIKCSLAQIYGRLPNQPMIELSDQQLDNKEQYCRDVLAVMDGFSPGVSRLRGLLSFELKVPVLMAANREFQHKLLTREEFLQRLHEGLSLLKLTVRCLHHESPEAFEGSICHLARGSISELGDWISTVKQLPEDNFLQAPFGKADKRNLSEQDLTLEDLLKQLDGH